MLLSVLVLHAVGAAGCLLGRKFKLPAGAMVGAMILTAVFSILTHSYFVYPDELRSYVQVLSGVIIGYKIGKSDILGMKRLIVPILILVPMIFVINVFFGVVSAKLGGLDYATALFACAPGGMTDMALIAQDLGANSAYVSIIQLSRMLFIVSVFPFIFRRRFKKSIAENAGKSVSQDELDTSEPSLKNKIIRFSLTLLIALAGGLLLKLVSFPAGMMVGAMIGAAALNISTGRAYAPRFMLDLVQALAGTYVGAGITMAMLMSMSDIIVPIICVILEVFVLSYTATLILSRVAKLPKSTCMLSGTPGGLQVISLLSEEFGFDTPSIIVMQTARLVAVISIFPLLLRFVTQLLP